MFKEIFDPYGRCHWCPSCKKLQRATPGAYDQSEPKCSCVEEESKFNEKKPELKQQSYSGTPTTGSFSPGQTIWCMICGGVVYGAFSGKVKLCVCPKQANPNTPTSWECIRCHKIHSPYKLTCDCQPVFHNSTLNNPAK